MSQFTGNSGYVSIRQLADGRAMVVIDYVPPCEDGTFCRTIPLNVTPEPGATTMQEWLKDTLIGLIEHL